MDALIVIPLAAAGWLVIACVGGLVLGRFVKAGARAPMR